MEEDQTWEVSTGVSQPCPEEAGTRVWLHVLGSSVTDVYHIGLPLISNQPMDVFVHISMFYSHYLSLSSLLTSLQGDPRATATNPIYVPGVTMFLFYGKLTFFFSMHHLLTVFPRVLQLAHVILVMNQGLFGSLVLCI